MQKLYETPILQIRTLSLYYSLVLSQQKITYGRGLSNHSLTLSQLGELNLKLRFKRMAYFIPNVGYSILSMGGYLCMAQSMQHKMGLALIQSN
ncbi:hypothetical protein AVO43_10435 [Microbulbifer sp. ZGT114]|nr:hypothetical protein AVO43_10435 [Microbulbifer sp. ZGT114]